MVLNFKSHDVVHADKPSASHWTLTIYYIISTKYYFSQKFVVILYTSTSAGCSAWLGHAISERHSCIHSAAICRHVETSGPRRRRPSPSPSAGMFTFGRNCMRVCGVLVAHIFIGSARPTQRIRFAMLDTIRDHVHRDGGAGRNALIARWTFMIHRSGMYACDYVYMCENYPPARFSIKMHAGNGNILYNVNNESEERGDLKAMLCSGCANILGKCK